ncbi:MAG: 23S rRNA (uracil(1939)-C(5))-methyltransferase RlmD, partial [Steroidobacterales bacterium]
MRASAVEEIFDIESLTQDGRGVARPGGKAVFIHGALPGERVVAKRVRCHRNYDEAATLRVERAAPQRVIPRCPHFGLCGGCALQHLANDAQLQAKERQLFDALERIGKASVAERLPPITADAWGYRRRARLGVKYVPKKGGVLVGFRESFSPLIAEIGECHVLPRQVSDLLRPLAQLIEALTIRSRIPQIEVTVADNALALVLRVLEAPDSHDRELIERFAAERAVEIYLQPGGLASVQALREPAQALCYALPRHDIRIQFAPTDFLQVNGPVNEQLVDRALEQLDPGPSDTVLDLFCGLGNFALPLARRAGRVVGVEGDAGLVDRARANAGLNGIENAAFHVANLAQALADHEWTRGRYDRVLLDPPRLGALEVLGSIARWQPARVVYVS